MAWNTNSHDNQITTQPHFMSKVFGWMFAALSITAAVSVYFSPDMNPHLARMIMQGPIFLIFLVQFILGMYFMSNVRSIRYATAVTLFTVYSALNGVILSSIFAVYTTQSIAYTFVVAAGMFGAMALYGAITKTDLSGMRSILLMGLFGLIIAGVMNIFVQSHAFSLVTACFGVGIFALLTAYDIQKLRALGKEMITTKTEASKVALLGAMMLYLDLINLFLYLLRLFGNRRN